MKRLIVLAAAVVTLVLLGSFVLESEAQAAVVQVRLKADVAVPYLVARPPRPILAPRRITMRIHHGGVGHVRLFGLGHHHHHTILVGHRAPRFVLRARLRPMDDHHPHFAHFGHGGGHGKVKIQVKGPSFRGPSFKGHGPGHGHGGGKGKFKVKF